MEYRLKPKNQIESSVFFFLIYGKLAAQKFINQPTFLKTTPAD